MNSNCAANGIETRRVEDEKDLVECHKNLVAVLCHDLRSLLASITATAEVFQEEFAAAPDDPKQEYLKILREQSRRIADFIEKVLEVHRLEAQQLTLQKRPLLVSYLVEATVRQWQLCAAGREIRLVLPDRTPWIWGDENALQCVLDNLLDNAIKYSPDQSAIEVSVQTVDGESVISVRDYGPGIPLADQGKIFQCFYRSKQFDAERVPGHGLGLYMCKMLMTAMGGSIRVDSYPGVGSCFRVSLPLMEGTL